MKILFYLRINVMGGAERYLLQLLPELKKRDIEVGFFCTRQGNNKEIIEYFIEQFDHYQIPVYVVNAAYTYSLNTAYCLSKIIRKERYTILSAHLMHAEIISALSKSLFKTSCKLVTTKHGYLQEFMDRYGLDYTKVNKLSFSYLVEKSLQRFVSGNFAVSKGLADFYIHSGICKASKMEVIYHGMDPYPNKENASPVRYSDNQLLVIARLKKFKGHLLLLEAVKILSEELPDLKLVILGVGEEMKNLSDTVSKYQLSHSVHFAGYTDNVYDYINGSDVIVVPSLAEPFGLIVLEAYSCAKPVIGFDVPALNENIIDGETGYLVTPYDTKALAENIKSLLQNKAMSKNMGEKGLALLKDKFSLKLSVERTIAFYQQVEIR